ncbi:ATP-binding protein [Argonema antarcticum]|uniref:ATP-binding protein n=1 Tax=Argonema antarcticum TaxID=2942763 RepID=UPI002011241B|nr:anti-sigma regulatory factor [Argonema antarcticum]MCL1474543.1 anti-sigma regulatory factor [Argonema antarcticum A004/B2]
MLQNNHLRVKSDLHSLNQVLQWFDRFCFQNKCKLSWLTDGSDRPNLALEELKLALVEGFTNAVRHAHKGLPPETPIEIELNLWDECLEIRIWDRGEPFDPSTLPEYKPGTAQEGGVGWFLMRRIADEVLYKRSQDGRNCLILIKHKV